MAAERRQEELEEDCVRAFKSGNKLMAEQLLPRIPLPAVRAVTTTFKLDADLVGVRVLVCSMVTLLHLAAYWGWGNVVTALVSVYYCAAIVRTARDRFRCTMPPTMDTRGCEDISPLNYNATLWRRTMITLDSTLLCCCNGHLNIEYPPHH